MKNFLLCIAAIAMLSGMSNTTVSAQNDVQLLTARGNDLNRNYLRPSLSVIYVTDGSSTAYSFASEFAKIPNAQFDENKISETKLTLDINNETPLDSIKNELTAYIQKNNIGKQIMKVWFPSFDGADKGYSLSMLEQRGNYAAKENDVLEAKASARSANTVLYDLGEQLIDRSYVVFYVFRKAGEGSDMVKVNGFLYKLNFDAEVRSDFYEKYFNNPNGIEQCNFPLEFLMYTKPNMIAGLVGVGKYSAKDITPKVVDEAFQQTNALIGRNVADWQIKETIAEVHPIRAKIGMKEGLKTDQRFYVMENVQKKDGSIKATRVGAVRVGMTIADNRFNAQDSINIDSEKKMTHFYQYCGGRIQEGQTLVYKPDLGIQIVPTLGFSEVGLGLQYRVSDLFASFFKGKSIPGVFIYAKFGLPIAYAEDGVHVPAYIPLSDGSSNGSEDLLSKAYLYTLSFGAGKELNFARMLSLSVYAGYGFYNYIYPKSAGSDNNKIYVNGKEFNGGYLEGQARLGMNMGPAIQLFVFGSYRYVLQSETRDLLHLKNIGLSDFNAGVGMSYNL